MPYWGALDGLRAIAVLAVMLFHAQWPGARGGFLGVDVFFVLSGFLITTQLGLELRTRGHIALGAFFMRRLVRLQPALWLLLLAYSTCAILTDWLPPTVAQRWGQDSAIVALAWAHWARAWHWNAVDYLGHSWSLGIEEQFYLLWALLLALVAGRHTSARRMALGCATAALASAGWMLWLHHEGASPSRLYNGLDTRAMALLTGCTLAWTLLQRSTTAPPPTTRARPLYGALAWILLALLLAAMHGAQWQQPAMFRYGYLLAALGSAGLVFCLLQPPGQGLTRWLAQPWLVRIGHWSYGLYLWHYPLFRLAQYHGERHQLPLAYSMAAATLLTFACAAASYHGLEMPLRRWYRRAQT